MQTVILRAEASLDGPNPRAAIREAVQAGRVALVDAELEVQSEMFALLHAIELEADRIDTVGVDGVRAKLAHARTVIKIITS